MKKVIISSLVIVCLALLYPVVSYSPTPVANGQSEKEKKKEEPKVGNSPNKVAGLELTPSMQVKADEQFVQVVATCTGDVEWLVLGTLEKIKYLEVKESKTLIVGIPNTNGLITVFAVGNVSGKLTQFARCDITVQVAEQPSPEPNPAPAPVTGSLNFTVIENPAQRTPAINGVLNSATFTQKLIAAGHFPRVYNYTDPKTQAMLNRTGLDKVLSQSGPLPVLIIQASDGSVKYNGPLPTSESALVAVITKLTGKPI